MTAASASRPGVWAAIGHAFRDNLLPGIGLNILAAALVWSYYRLPAAAGWWQAVGDCKARWSFLFSFLATALTAAALPFLIQLAMGRQPAGKRWLRLAALALFMGYRGVEVDLFYQGLGLVFGHGHDVGTLAAKVAIDQFVYSAIWTAPTNALALRWIEHDCSWTRTRATLDRSFWTHTYPTMLFTTWMVWLPTVTMVYSLPKDLQFPLFSVVCCFFILVVTLLAGRTARQP